ncbi:putative myosin head, motor domain, P-loop containing nucleoside triphosphate hydrolase [Helianthus annuus]|nr:putative myosin head, motor domain, P-loop containing nucleoside triphosphate hydrolase [Helianthus annuus]
MIQAMDSRDALAKLLYSCLFDWLVEQITFCRETSVWEDPSAFLIFMDPNHLTYEYIQDCIDWAKVDFEDNQACLSLFEKVKYDTTGFLEKTRDLLHSVAIQLLSSYTCKLPQNFASSMLSLTEKPTVGSLNKSGGADSQKLSVTLKFRG